MFFVPFVAKQFSRFSELQCQFEYYSGDLQPAMQKYQKNSYPIIPSTAIAAVSVRRMFGPSETG